MSASRHIQHAGNPDAVDWLQEKLVEICGSAQLRSFQFVSETYFNIEADIPGLTSELVVIGAHLDSTAANDFPYQPATDPAPGADDDASGVVGVLEVARVLKALADQVKPQRTIRFVLFNAEEQGMRGSRAYTRDLKEAQRDRGGPALAAMLAMDMIGWHSAGNAPYAFEIHGTGSDEYKSAKLLSDQLSDRIVQAAALVAPDLSPQVHPLPNCGTDPATGHSDHSSFHYHGWPACLLSEDMWVSVCKAGSVGPPPAGNPNYHRASDLPAALYLDYAADIARTVAAVAWMEAK